MNPQLLTNSWQRALGAMFKKTLKETVLVFIYPHPAKRLFHTFFCPPIRILALNDQGEILSDQVVRPNQFVPLPETRLILETAPETRLTPEELQALASPLSRMPPSLSTGAIDREVAFHKLLFAMVADALLNLRRLRRCFEAQNQAVLSVDTLRQTFNPEERGELLNSALFLLAYPKLWTLPSGALKLARTLLRVEGTSGFLEELLAASVCLHDWKRDFPQACIRCGFSTGSWQPVLAPREGLSAEEAWRYARPENHVFICRKCAYKIGWHKRATVRLTLAYGVWGARFEAFQRWHNPRENTMPDGWDKKGFPLWPESYGGDTWETGSGAMAYADPRPPDGVQRTPEQLACLKKALGHPRTGRLCDIPLRKAVSLEASHLFSGETR